MKQALTQQVTEYVKTNSSAFVEDMMVELPSYSRQSLRRAAYNAVACGYIKAEPQQRNALGHPLPILYYCGEAE